MYLCNRIFMISLPNQTSVSFSKYANPNNWTATSEDLNRVSAMFVAQCRNSAVLTQDSKSTSLIAPYSTIE